MLQAVTSEDEDTLQAGLAQLVEAELLYQRGRPPRARYMFKHALIQEAGELLAPVYEWFTEGFDTADLKEAKGLLDALS